jgi:hypothetical protein
MNLKPDLSSHSGISGSNVSYSPPPVYFQNSAICKGFEKFISDTLLERIANDSLSVLGRVGECDPPLLDLPITIEPSKPRMCHDERYLHL